MARRLGAGLETNPMPYVVGIVLTGIYLVSGLVALLGGLSSGVITGILAVTFGAVLLVLAWFRFWWFLILLLVARSALDGIKSNANQAGQLDPSTIVGAVFLVVGVTWLLVQYRQGAWTKLSRTAKVGAVFALAMAISSLGADHFKDSMVASTRLLSVVILLVVFEQVFSKHPERLGQALMAVYASLVIPIAVGYWQAVHPSSGPQIGANGADLSRIHSTFVHPNAFATYLVMLTLLAVGLYPHVNFAWRRAFLVMFVAVAPLIVFTYARGAWISLCIGLFFLGFVQSPRLVVALLAGIVIVMIAVPSVSSRLSDLSQKPTDAIGSRGAAVTSTVRNKVEPNSLSWRFSYWGRVLPLVGQNPVTGIGYEMVRETTPEQEPPHDVFVQTLTEGGIAGFTVFMLFLLTLGLDLRRARRRSRPGLEQGMAVATIAAAIGVLAELLTENMLSEIALLWYFLVPVAWVLAVVGRRYYSPREDSPDLVGTSVN